MKRINLENSNKPVLVDDNDYLELIKYKWWFNGRSSITGYINNKNIILSHFIYKINNILFDEEIDHKDRNIFNAQKSNFRPANRSDQIANTGKRKGNYSSKYKGIFWCKTGQNWRARITVNYRIIEIGRFYNEVEAAKAYDRAAKKYFKQFACLNFSE